jgi:pectate lyase
MTTKMISLFALCVLLGTVMLACGGAAENTNTATTNTAANTNTKTAATPAASPASTTTTSSGGDIGVAACDEFLKKYEACVSGKVPAAAQATFKTSLDNWRSSWKKLAETPQGKAGLEAACKSSLDAAKTSLASYNCSW